MSTATDRVKSTMDLILAESERNLANLKDIEAKSEAVRQALFDTQQTLIRLEKQVADLEQESANLKNRALKLIINHLEKCGEPSI